MRPFALLAVLALAAGCTSYPSLAKTGTVKVRPENGRVLSPASAGGKATVYVDVVNNGGADDTLMGVMSEVAGRAELRSRHGTIDHIVIPAATMVPLASEDRHIQLYDLKRELREGDVIIVTLLLQKSGAIGAITVVK